MRFLLLITFSISSTLASLGNLVPTSEIPESICLAEFSKGDEVFHCSGAMVDRETFKTAAHCYKEDYQIEVRCKSGEKFPVEKVLNHKLFSKRDIKRDLFARRYDHALLKIEGGYTGELIETVKSYKDLSSECAFFGVGLNPYISGTGYLHGVHTNSNRLTQENGLLILNDPFGALTMIGDSGASFLCKNSQNNWVNIGTVSAHSWDNETIIASNETLNEDTRLSINEAHYVSTIVKEPSYNSQIKKGETYDVLPFSSYSYKGEVLNLADRLNSKFHIEEIKNGLAIGTLEHFGPSLYYLCLDGISCEETLRGVSIDLSRLVEDYDIPLFIKL